jgi:arginyl-tRNA synthetase
LNLIQQFLFLYYRFPLHLFELSQIFNRFYDQVPVLKAEEPARSCRLALCRLSADTLRLGLGLLGIPSLERM